MRKLVALGLMVLLVVSAMPALAEDLGVQVIGGKNTVMETLTLDDMKLEQLYTIEGYARITLTLFEFRNSFIQYSKDKNGNNKVLNSYYHDVTDKLNYSGSDYYEHIYWKDSGKNAEFAWLTMDIVNMQKEPQLFMQNMTVKVVFDDEYEYAGWVRQFNYDYDTSRKNEGTYGTFIRAALDPGNEEPIDIVYTGHYVFGCTLPNVVVEGKEPLRMEIKLGDNDLTYHIRK